MREKKKYCTYSFTLVNKKFVRSFVLSLSPPTPIYKITGLILVAPSLIVCKLWSLWS